MTQASDASAFEKVDLWIFDLDNTLYPRPHQLWQDVHARMQGFIGDQLGVDQPTAAAMQTDYFQRYGLTLRGLMVNHGVDPDAYLAHVHDVDLSEIVANAALGAAIGALPGRRVIHTNSDLGHTERVLDRLGIGGAFDAIYDIKGLGYEAKPAAGPFNAVLAAEGGNGQRAAMFEDITHNLRVPHDLGMKTVWVPTTCDWASHGADGEHIHFVAEDLTGFVEALNEGKAAA